MLGGDASDLRDSGRVSSGSPNHGDQDSPDRLLQAIEDGLASSGSPGQNQVGPTGAGPQQGTTGPPQGGGGGRGGGQGGGRGNHGIIGHRRNLWTDAERIALMQSHVTNAGFTHHQHADELQRTLPNPRGRRSTNAVREEHQILTQRRVNSDQQTLRRLQGGGAGTGGSGS